MENFLGVIADAEKINQQLDMMDKILYITMLVEAATDIDRDSHLLFLMAKTYTDISSRYMESQIAGISGLLTIQTPSERELFLQSIANATVGIAEQIKGIATDRQSKYEDVNFARQLEYMEFIEESTKHEAIDILGGIGIGKR